ncbi:MAG: hypothetical protein K2H23_09140 [Oscillospiraceae bacterium]|nr:hypothetical protein [Oscillospiraceae bacterium]
MDDKKLNSLENGLDMSAIFLKAAEEVKQANAERDERNKAKAAAAVDRRRRGKALDEAYAEYCRNNPPTDSECRKAAEIIKSCIKRNEEK